MTFNKAFAAKKGKQEQEYFNGEAERSRGREKIFGLET